MSYGEPELQWCEDPAVILVEAWSKERKNEGKILDVGIS